VKKIVYGTVTRNTDRVLGYKLRGAVYFQSEQLADEHEYPIPARPSFPFAGNNYGIFVVPQQDDQIEIEIDEDLNYPEPRYRAVLYSDVDEIPEEFKTNYPFRMGWKTPGGHLLMFDDKEGQELIKLAHTIGTGFEWTTDGDWLETVVRDKIIEVTRNFVMECSNMKFGSSGSSENLVLGQVFVTYATTLCQIILDHKHPTAVGPTGSMIDPDKTLLTNLKASPIDDNAIISDKSFTEK